MKRLVIAVTIAALAVGIAGCVGGDGNNGSDSYTLIVDFTHGGAVTVDDLPIPGRAILTYNPGTVVSLNATPSAGYQFVNWTGNVSTIDNVNAASTSVTVNDDYEIIANFEAIPPIRYTLTIGSTPRGNVTDPGEGTFTYDQGTNVNLVAVTDEGYFFEEWVGDVGGIADVENPTTAITMDADYFVTASFGYPTTQRATILIDGNPDDWSSLEPALVDPQGDCICDADDDVKHIYTAMDDSCAYVMVETYGVPIDESATIEINFDYKPGIHSPHGSACCDDLHTNISGSSLYAVTDDDLNGIDERYPINGYVIAWGDVMELKIPLSQIENATWFNPTFVNTWDDSYQPIDYGCDGSFVYFGNWH